MTLVVERASHAEHQHKISCIHISIYFLQDDQSSVVHLAAANGHLDILKLLFEKQPEKKAMCIRAKDCQGRTPLHRAAIFDRSEVVTYLLAEVSWLANC